METFHLAHLIVLAMWLGVVITEVLFEFAGSDADSLRAAARFHYNVDKFGELRYCSPCWSPARSWQCAPGH